MTLDVLTEVFRKVFDDESLVIHETTTADEVDGWDSMSHVVLIVAVEERFKVKFSQRDLLALRNVGDLVKAIDAKLQPQR